MLASEIEKIWPAAIKARISAKVHLPDTPTCILGFDTEYLTHAAQAKPGVDSTEKLPANIPVSWQLHDGINGHFMPLGGKKLKLSALHRAAFLIAKDKEPQARHIVLATWYAQAELSMIELDMKCRLLSHGNNLYGLQWSYIEEEGAHKKKVSYTFTIFDLMAFYGKMSLASASEHLPQPKRSWNHSLTTLESVDNPEFQDYSLHDAYLCFRLAVDLHDQFSLAWGVSPFEMISTGYMASGLFRKGFMESDHKGQPKAFMQPHPDVRRMALTAYRGSGDYGTIYQAGIFEGYAEYDGRSMYPTACAILEFLPTREDWRPWLADQFGQDFPERGMYRAQIDWPEGEVRRTLMAQVAEEGKEEAFTYPQRAVDYWTGFELAAARRAGCNVRIIEGWYFETGSTMFPRFLEQMTRKRLNFQTGKTLLGKPHAKNPALAAVYKNVGNTIIGKLGQHRLHAHYETVYNPTEKRVEYAPSPESRGGLGGVFMPEWWVLIVGYSRAAMMDVIHQRRAIHAQVDAVLIPDCGPEFEHMGIVFRRKSSGEKLRLAAKNTWIFESGGEVTRFAAGSGGRDLPELRAVFQTWNGQEIVTKYEVEELVSLAEHAYRPEQLPLLARVHGGGTFKLPRLEGGNENARTQDHSGSGTENQRRARPARKTPDAGSTAANSAAPQRPRAEPKKSAGGSRAGSAPARLGRTVNLLIDWNGVTTEKRVKRQKETIYRSVLAVLGTNYPDLSGQVAAAIMEGMSYQTTLKSGSKLRVEIMD